MIKNGNVSEINKNYKNWFLGKFVKEPEFSTENSRDFEVKWSVRESGYFHPPKDKVVNDDTCSSMVLCIKGKFKYSFIKESGEYEDFILESEGDFVRWTPDINHKVEVLEDAIILTIRWYK